MCLPKPLLQAGLVLVAGAGLQRLLAERAESIGEPAACRWQLETSRFSLYGVSKKFEYEIRNTVLVGLKR